MLEWLSVILLIVVALILIVAELIFVPGTTLVGLIGVACMVLGIYLSFDYFGSDTGWIVLGISSISGFAVVVYGRFKEVPGQARDGAVQTDRFRSRKAGMTHPEPGHCRARPGNPVFRSTGQGLDAPVKPGHDMGWGLRNLV